MQREPRRPRIVKPPPDSISESNLVQSNLEVTQNLTPPPTFSTDKTQAVDATGARLARFSSIEEMVKVLRPCEPVYCLHQEQLTKVAQTFLNHFPGRSLYAVKTNPDANVLRRLYADGIRSFDVASLGEMKLVHGLFPDASMAYMHPVKSRESIRAAYFDYGVRTFAIDTFEEMHKILEETQVAADLTIMVRLAMPKGSAAMELTGKFGASPEFAASLLRDADRVAHAVGISFHVGSQTLDTSSYASAIQLAGHVVKQSGVTLDVFDVGGGFPVSYPGSEVPELVEFFDVIREEVIKLKLPKTCQVWGEPGRAMVASAETLVVRVELRKDNALYINDGGYGSLFDACHMRWVYPVSLIRQNPKGRKAGKPLLHYHFFGPTCDSIDVMPGPFLLPADVCEGDWIAISQMGAYGRSMQTRFNGFYSDHQVEIDPLSPVQRLKRSASSAAEKVVRFADYL